jgi:hypothetical protein
VLARTGAASAPGPRVGAHEQQPPSPTVFCKWLIINNNKQIKYDDSDGHREPLIYFNVKLLQLPGLLHIVNTDPFDNYRDYYRLFNRDPVRHPGRHNCCRLRARARNSTPARGLANITHT